MTINEFIAKWRKVELKERSAAQTHFIDLCRVCGHPDPVSADPIGGPWERYIDPATVEDRGTFKVGTVRYPRLVARDAECAAKLKDRTLTKLYNARPAWLANCRQKLDAAVAGTYNWPANLPDDAILERLLALNRAQAETTT